MKTTSTLFILLLLSHFTSFSQYTKLFDFNGTTTGGYPHYGALVSDGTYLYGTTSNGGSAYSGTVFKIKKDGTDFMMLHEFTDVATGIAPEGGVTLLGDYLYGTTKLGGELYTGAVYRIKKDGTDFSVLAIFDADIQGRQPMSALYYDGTTFFGTASGGGASGHGTIYKINPDGSDFAPVFEFVIDGYTGSGPQGQVISDGTYFYGLTVGGGTLGQGTAYRVKKDGTEYQTLVDFTDDPTGTGGYGELAFDGVEYLYGMTNTGGEYNRGTTFKVKTDGTGYVKLLDMNNDDGAQPLGSPILVGNTLYAMTELAGNDTHGNLYSIGIDGSNYQLLVDFNDDNGSLPFGTLLYEDGILYGYTTEGGDYDRGVLFSNAVGVPTHIDANTHSALKLYPNPAKDFLTIELPLEYKDCNIEISNAVGAIVRSEKINGISARIDLRSFAAGVYNLKCVKGAEVVVRQVVVE